MLEFKCDSRIIGPQQSTVWLLGLSYVIKLANKIHLPNNYCLTSCDLVFSELTVLNFTRLLSQMNYDSDTFTESKIG